MAVIPVYRPVSYVAYNKAIYGKPYADGRVGNLPVRKTAIIDLPLIIGLFKPVLYIPDMDIKTEDLKMMLIHLCYEPFSA